MNGKKIVGWMVRDGIAVVGCSSMGAGSIGGKNYCGNLLWQSSLTLLPPCIGTAAYVHSGVPLSLFSGGKSYKCARGRVHYFKRMVRVCWRCCPLSKEIRCICMTRSPERCLQALAREN